MNKFATELPASITTELFADLTELQRDFLFFTELSEPYLPTTEEWQNAYVRIVNSLLQVDQLEREVAREWINSHLDPLVTKRKEVHK